MKDKEVKMERILREIKEEQQKEEEKEEDLKPVHADSC